MTFDPETHQETFPAPAGVAPPVQDEAARLSEELYRAYSSVQEPWATRAMDSRAFVHNHQFTQEQIKKAKARGQAAVSINVLWPAMEQAVAMLTANSPAFQATAKEDSDMKTARAIADLLAHEWAASSGNSELKDALYDMFQTGRGVMYAFVDPNADYGRGRVCFRSIDATSVYPDPNAKDKLWRDAAHVLVHHVMTGEQILAIWRDAKDILAYTGGTLESERTAQANRYHGDWRMNVDEVTDTHHTRYEVIERFSKVLIDYTHTVEPNGEERIFLPENIGEFLEAPAFVVITPQGPQFFTGDKAREGEALLREAQPTENPAVFLLPPPVDPATGQPMGEPMPLTVTTNGDLVGEGVIAARTIKLPRVLLNITIGGFTYWKKYLPISEYPFAPINGRWDRNPFPMSDVEFVRPIQESINKLHMQIIANLANSTNVKVLVPRGAVDRRQLEEDFAKAGTAVIEFDAEFGQPVIVSPLPPPVGLFNYMGTLQQTIERELGVFSVQQGDPTGAPPTYKGTLAIDEYGQRRIKSKLDDVEAALTHLGRVALQLIQHIYTEERIIRLLKPNNAVSETVVNQLRYDDYGNIADRINDVTVGEYDVTVVSGSTLPSNRWALLEYYMQMYQMQIIDQVEVLKKTDVADAEAVLERMGRIAQLEQALGQAQEEIKRLRGDLQTAQREEENAIKQARIARFEASLEGPKEQARKAAQLYEARMQDELTLVRKENAQRVATSK